MTSYVEEITYSNHTDSITISGTLTLPDKKGPFPVAMLIAGMGAMDRDATFMGHKRFATIAEHLTQTGVAVLRVDKRGVGKSTGILDPSVTSQDLARDVRAGLEYLKTRAEIDPNRIGLIGHSEGGLIATIIAAQSKDIAFVILMSGALLTSVDGQIQTTAQQLRFDGASEEMILQDCTIRKQVLAVVTCETNVTIAAQKMNAMIDEYWPTLSQELKKEAATLAFAFTLAKKDGLISTFNSPWFRFFLSCDVLMLLRQITIPLLALNGERDFNNVPHALSILHKAMQDADNPDYTALTLPKLNHNFQTCQTGSIPEYGTLKEGIAPEVLQLMAEWIKARFGNK